MIKRPTIDTISPVGMGGDKIVLSLSTQTDPPYAFQTAIVDVDYSAADPDGIVPPLELIIQPTFGPGGSTGGYIRTLYSDTRPLSVTWKPQGAGQYLIVLRELFHNQWQGRLLVDVDGDPTSVPEDPFRYYERY
jgi:hypothetical protein